MTVCYCGGHYRCETCRRDVCFCPGHEDPTPQHSTPNDIRPGTDAWTQKVELTR